MSSNNLSSLAQRVTGTESDASRFIIELDDDELQLVEEVLEERHHSYEAGDTKDTAWGDSVENMRLGIVAEVAVVGAYEGAELDRRVSKWGDDGYDVVFPLGGSEQNVDVKGRSAYDPDLMVRQDRDHTQADAFLLAYVPDSMDECHLLGWEDKEKLCVPANSAPSPYGHMNWVQSHDELKEPPEPSPDRAWERR